MPCSVAKAPAASREAGAESPCEGGLGIADECRLRQNPDGLVLVRGLVGWPCLERSWFLRVRRRHWRSASTRSVWELCQAVVATLSASDLSECAAETGAGSGESVTSISELAGGSVVGIYTQTEWQSPDVLHRTYHCQLTPHSTPIEIRSQQFPDFTPCRSLGCIVRRTFHSSPRDHVVWNRRGRINAKPVNYRDLRAYHQPATTRHHAGLAHGRRIKFFSRARP